MNRKSLHIILWLLFLQLKIFAQNDSLKGQEIYSSNFTIDGRERTILYYIPLNYMQKQIYPLVIFLHGAGSSGKNMIKTYGDILHAKADAADCIIMYPDAFGGKWDSAGDSVNDVGFITIMISYFIQVYHADPNRVYLMGISVGGEMALRTACAIPYEIAAVAAFTGDAKNGTGGCTIAKSVAVMDTKKYPQQILQKPDSNAISEAIGFLLMQKKQ